MRVPAVPGSNLAESLNDKNIFTGFCANGKNCTYTPRRVLLCHSLVCLLVTNIILLQVAMYQIISNLLLKFL